MAGYKAFTRRYDVETYVENLHRVLDMPTPEVELEDVWRAFESGLLVWKTRLDVECLALSKRLRAELPEELRKDTIVTLLIDQSGSMRGQKMLMTAASADIVQDFLRGLGIAVEILGFTTRSWRGGKSRWLWILRGRPQNPGRLCDLLHIIYKDANEAWDGTGSWSFLQMLRPELAKENIDGEAIQWAAGRLRARPERHRKLLVISDGAPVDDSTLDANDLEYLQRHLEEVIAALQSSGDIAFAALGIDHWVERYYPRFKTVSSLGDIGPALLGLLAELLTVPADVH